MRLCVTYRLLSSICTTSFASSPKVAVICTFDLHVVPVFVCSLSPLFFFFLFLFSLSLFLRPEYSLITSIWRDSLEWFLRELFRRSDFF